jgi:hypothetical protein
LPPSWIAKGLPHAAPASARRSRQQLEPEFGVEIVVVVPGRCAAKITFSDIAKYRVALQASSSRKANRSALPPGYDLSLLSATPAIWVLCRLVA